MKKRKLILKGQKPPVVVKATDWRPAKGVVVANTIDEALTTLADFMDRKTLGDAGNRIIIGNFLPAKR